ncbi:MAG: M48 family metallopeptidase [Nitrospiraceae bacterium]|nr:M48 family metallopeptidase [Nitrospiraceae bacterium]
MKLYAAAFLAIYVLTEGFEYLVRYLNLKHMRRAGYEVPPEFRGEMDEGALKRALEYEEEKTRFSFISSIAGNIGVIIFLFGGLLNAYNSWIAGLNLPFAATGWLFFLLVFYLSEFLGVPFSLYHTFKTENKYGFNKMTGRLWISDFIKSLIISSVMFSIMAFAGFGLMRWNPAHWWFWIWAFLFVFSIFMMYISPRVIEPLFNKFVPLEDESLKEKVIRLAERAGIKAGRILKVDASKRSTHSNAYFTGVGKTKRIVLFDTLLKGMKEDETLSVIAHEIGHWKKKHLLKMMIIFEAMSFAGLWAAYYLIKGSPLSSIFGIREDTVFAKLVLIGFLAGLISLPLRALMNLLSRRHEDEADAFSCSLTGEPQAMAGALVKLSKENLSNPHPPHPLYVTLYYSHPPVLKRIRRILK